MRRVKERGFFGPLGVFLLPTFFFSFFITAPVHAIDYYWIGGPGDWSDPVNWNPTGPPQGTYPNQPNVYLTQSDSVDRTVTLSTSAGRVGNLTIDATGTGSMNLLVGGGSVIPFPGGYRMTVGLNGTGTVNQIGGSIGIGIITGVQLGVNSGSTGIYNISDGTLNADVLRVGGSGTGILNQTGGVVYAEWDQGSVGPQGTYNLSGGNATMGNFGMSGTFNLSGSGSLYTSRSPEAIGGTFNQTGGTHRGTIDLAGTYNLGAGNLTANVYNSGGTFNLSGGVLDATTSGFRFPLPNGGFANRGTFNYSGGELHVGTSTADPHYPGGLMNYGTTNLSGQGTRTVDGDVLNNGTFKVTNTTAVYTGTFTNNGVYISDPATQYFKDLLIGQNGYFVGQQNDKFYISGDFINKSTMNTVWNTKEASLAFLEGANSIHQLYLTGADYGRSGAGYVDNFSWGTLDLTGEDLNLQDGNDMPGGALYLREILGLDISGNLITNIFDMDGFDIYYDPTLDGNRYLGGQTYDLSGGGRLMSVPEPATLLLVGPGLIGLVGFRRKFRK